MMAFHERLGKVFGAFQYRTCLGRADNRNTGRTLIFLKDIVDTLYQRIFGADDNHVDLFLNGKILEVVEVVYCDCDILTDCFRTGITWCDKEFATLCTLCNLPCQGVFTTATA